MAIREIVYLFFSGTRWRRVNHNRRGVVLSISGTRGRRVNHNSEQDYRCSTLRNEGAEERGALWGKDAGCEMREEDLGVSRDFWGFPLENRSRVGGGEGSAPLRPRCDDPDPRWRFLCGSVDLLETLDDRWRC